MKFRSLFWAVVLVLTSTMPLLAQSTSRSVNVTFTTIDVPGAGYTISWGMNNNGMVVGTYGQDTSTDDHGFLYDGALFSYFDYPGETITSPTGINDSNLIVGTAGTGSVFGFLYDGASFTKIQVAGMSRTFALGINNAGTIVGAAGGLDNAEPFEMLNGKFKMVRVPGHYVDVRAWAINNLGNIAGLTEFDGFFCHNINTCKILSYPGASDTQTFGINDSGVVVGWYISSACTGGCAFASKNGKFISFAFPGAAFTGAGGINNLGQIVGGYTFDNQTWHGFVTNPITAADFQ